jgi:UDP-N-acetylglucosamine diphosphorylase/glucosamine-1-phosphate N-acetyltransferase
MKRIILLEDSRYQGLYPLACLRPVFQLRCGAFSLLERFRRLAGKARMECWVLDGRRQVLAASGRNAAAEVKAVGAGKALLVNGRAVLPNAAWQRISKTPPNVAFLHQDQLVAAVVQDVILHQLPTDAPDPECLEALVRLCKTIELKEGLASHPWDLVNLNGRMIEDDAPAFKDGGQKLGPGTSLLGKRTHLRMVRNAVVEPGVVLDTRSGPIIIDGGALVRGPGRIEGPCYIGSDCLVDGARLRPGVSLGRCCRASGEVEESVFMDFSNKHHDGFLGHSYVGSWVNLGAQTCNSDLKNNYSSVSVWSDGYMVDTGSIKVGCFIGDHVKTAIGTMINTGTVIGPGCNVFGGPARKQLPPFSWGCSGSFRDHSVEKMLETAAAAMARRRQRLTPEMAAAIRELFRATAGMREKPGKGGSA